MGTDIIVNTDIFARNRLRQLFTRRDAWLSVLTAGFPGAQPTMNPRLLHDAVQEFRDGPGAAADSRADRPVQV